MKKFSYILFILVPALFFAAASCKIAWSQETEMPKPVPRIAGAGFHFPFLKWQYSAGGPITSSPAAGLDGTVYFGCDDGFLYALNPDGTLKWQFKTGKPIRSAPAIGLDGTIYFGCDDGYLYAVSPAGKLRWRYPVQTPVRSDPAVSSHHIIFFTAGGTCHALTADGILYWHYDTGLRILSSPAVGPDREICFGGEQGNIFLLSPAGELRWQRAPGFYVLSAPAFGPDGMIYIGSGHNLLIAVNSEGDMQWRSGQGNFRVSRPSVAPDGTAVAGSDSSFIYAVRDGKEIWNYRTRGWITAAPRTDAEGFCYAGSWDGHLYGISPDGKSVWKYAADSAIRTVPAIGKDGSVYFGTDAGVIHALGLPPGKSVLAGTVTSYETGNPFAETLVTIRPLQAGKAQHITTGTDGTYRFLVSPGTWEMEIAPENIRRFRREFEIPGEKVYKLDIALQTSAPLNIQAGELATGMLDTPYNQKIGISGGKYPYHFKIVDGELPDGISLDQKTGLLAGTPDFGCETGFSIEVRDAEGATARRQFRLMIDEPLRFETTSLDRAAAGSPYEFRLKTRGSGKPHQFWLKEDSAFLPPGFRLSNDTGEISGLPETPGKYAFSLKVGDASGTRWATGDFELEIFPQLIISTGFLPDAVTGQPYSTTLRATGGYGKKEWWISGVPPGLSLDIAPAGKDSEKSGIFQAVLSGILNQPVESLIRVAVADVDSRLVQKDFLFQAVLPLKLEQALPLEGITGKPCTGAIQTSGGTPPMVFRYTGDLPEGLSLDPRTGVISGTPEEAAWTNIRVTVEDSTAPRPQQIADIGVSIRIQSEETP